eukprot:6440904-Amphidinium_carterae.1
MPATNTSLSITVLANMLTQQQLLLRSVPPVCVALCFITKDLVGVQVERATAPKHSHAAWMPPSTRLAGCTVIGSLQTRLLPNPTFVSKIQNLLSNY